MSDRYHRAAQDGYLEVLKETTKRDCNTKDEDGMTPTLWAAFEGNLDALRLLVGRGGDPEKCDNYGNTALHLAAARGHMNCVTFLVNFGVNIWSMDIDQHTPQELAAMNDCNDILRFLDVTSSKMEQEDPRKVKKMQKQAEKDAQDLVKNFKKVQKKADSQSKKKEKDLETEKKKMQLLDPATGDIRRDSIAVHQAHLNFSDMVGLKNSGKGTSTPRTKKMIGTVFQRAQKQKARIQDSTFKVRGLEDGKQTVRNLSGLRRDSEVMFMAAKDSSDQPDDNNDVMLAPPPQAMVRRDTFGIFNRAGFGEVAFRRDSMAATLYAVQNDSTGDREDSLEDADSDNSDPQGTEAQAAGFGGPIDMFLAGLGLQQYIKVFRKQKIDLETLMLLNEQNLLEMKIEIGPRKKILKAIEERKRDMAEAAEEELEDSRL